jgi:Ulp1 protease family, C-terminal catalytic domain
VNPVPDPLENHFVLRYSVRRHDLLTLKPEKWIKDAIVNAYFGMLEHQSGGILKERDHNGRPIPFKLVDSQTWSRLHRCHGSITGHSQLLPCDLNAVQSWTRIIPDHVVSAGCVLFPINPGNNHWALAVVTFSSRTVQIFDSMASPTSWRGKVNHAEKAVAAWGAMVIMQRSACSLTDAIRGWECSSGRVVGDHTV